MKLIMENWRKFLAEQNIRDSFYYTNYEEEPLTDEELKLIMNPEPGDDEAAIARKDLIQHLEDTGEGPVQLLRMAKVIMGLRKKDELKFPKIKMRRLTPPKGDDRFKFAVVGADGTQQSVPIKSSQYAPSENLKNGMKIIVLNEMPNKGVKIVGLNHRLKAELTGAGGAGLRWSGEPDEDRSKAQESGRLSVGVERQSYSGYVLAPAFRGPNIGSDDWKYIELPDGPGAGEMAPNRCAFWLKWKPGQAPAADVIYFEFKAPPGERAPGYPKIRGGSLLEESDGEIRFDPDHEFQGIVVSQERGAVLMDPSAAENAIKTGAFVS